ncbi:MAG TPA: hypothetical protein VGC87_23155 [Pyrinomonadaceae bacterium]|jgi:hypothetical protein
MSWQNAPALNKLAASQLIGKNGAQIWGVDYRGRLHTSYQSTPGGEWSKWLGADWAGAGYPKQVYELCASQQHEGEAQLWVLDVKRQLWTIKQDKQGNWSKWQNDWNKPPGSFHFKKMAAAWVGNHGARFWGITEDGILTSCPQSMPAGNWGAWGDWPKTPHDLKKNPPELPAAWIEVTACNQGDGRGALWALDTKMQLWGMGQASPGSSWGAWNGPNWLGAPKLRNIAAVETAVKRGNETIHGACIFGITDDYKIVYNEQARSGSNDWFGWSVASFKDTLRGYEITAARQNNQSARVWAIGNDQTLVSQQVNIDSSPPSWERFWTPDI